MDGETQNKIAMIHQQFNRVRRGVYLAAVAIACVAGVSQNLAVAKGGSGGGGGGGGSVTTTSRVTGYVTAIDHEAGTISIGASYYGSGALKVTNNTKIQLNLESTDFDELQLGDWVEARYDFATKTATKLDATR